MQYWQQQALKDSARNKGIQVYIFILFYFSFWWEMKLTITGFIELPDAYSIELHLQVWVKRCMNKGQLKGLLTKTCQFSSVALVSQRPIARNCQPCLLCEKLEWRTWQTVLASRRIDGASWFGPVTEINVCLGGASVKPHSILKEFNLFKSRQKLFLELNQAFIYRSISNVCVCVCVRSEANISGDTISLAKWWPTFSKVICLSGTSQKNSCDEKFKFTSVVTISAPLCRT